jgi:hypothetical protein
MGMGPAAGQGGESYRDFAASVLFCGRCQRAVPVRERLLLYLPDGELHEYRCQVCGGSLGTKKVSTRPPAAVLRP